MPPPSEITDEKPMRKRRGEIEHRRADRARLRDQRETARQRRRRAERRVEADVGADDAERARADERASAASRAIADIARTTRARRRDRRRAGALISTAVFSLPVGSALEDLRHGVRRRRDDREVDRLPIAASELVRATAEHARVVRIDRIQRRP